MVSIPLFLSAGVLVAVLAAVAVVVLRFAQRTGAPGALESELRSRLAAQEAEATTLRAALASARESEVRAQAESGALRSSLEELKERHQRDLEERRRALEAEMVALKDSFKALSADALREIQPQVLSRIREVVGALQGEQQGDLERRHQAIQGLVDPLVEQLKAYAARLQQYEKDQNQGLGDVRAQLEGLRRSSVELSRATERFSMVLSSNQARGRWGEETLRRVVEAAGMSPHCDFSEQEREGDSQPDMVVHLPGGRSIVVDAKTPNLEFVQQLESGAPERRGELLKSHAAAVAERVRELSRRAYASKIAGSLDYVVLFLPAESLFSLALESDRDLLVRAAEQKVLLATPATLIGLLKGVSVCWTQDSQMENAREINIQAQELLRRVAVFLRHFDALAKGLAAATQAYNAAVGSYTQRVVPVGRSLQRLQGQGDDAFEERTAIEFTPRIASPPPGDVSPASPA